MSQALPTKVRAWIATRLSQEVARSIERMVTLDDIHAIALMPDVHLAEDVCIGAVVVTKEHIYPDAVGSDIGCGMACARLRGGPERLGEQQARRILDGLRSRVPANRQRHRQPLPDEWTELVLVDEKRKPLWTREHDSALSEKRKPLWTRSAKH